MNRYSYDGPVLQFETYVDYHFHGETVAETEKKAKANITYQWKKQHNLVSGAKITLPGKVIKED